MNTVEKSVIVIALAVATAVASHWPAGAQEAPLAGTAYSVELRLEGPDNLTALLRQASRLTGKEREGAATAARLERRIRSDIEAFGDILRSEGYYAFSITRRTVPGRTRQRIVISVEPGPLFLIGRLGLDLDGEAALGEEILAQAELQSGQPARSEDIVTAERVIVQGLAERGHPFAKLGEREVIVDHQSRRVAVLFRIEPGPRTRFGAVAYEGIETVETPYLDRFITWSEGEPYAQDKIDRFRRRLIATGLFSSVSLRPEPPVEDDGRADILAVLGERNHRTIAIGGGFSTAEGFGGEVSWEHRNFLGRQERMRLELTGSEIEQSLTAHFLKPHFRRPDQNLNLNAGIGREDTDAFDQFSLEAGAAIERPLAKHLNASAGIRAEFLSIEENGEHDEFVILGAPVSLNWNSADDPLDPKKGFRLLNSVQPGLLLVEENDSYIRMEQRGAFYYGLGAEKKVVLALRSRLGATLGIANDRLPASERFFSGGGGSIRGFGFQDVGPRDADGDPLGGRSVAEIGLEIRARLSERIGLVPFIEGGNVYTERFPQFRDFRWGAGVGLRYYTSVAPIRVDFAFPINDRPGDASFQVYISFGQSF